MQVTITKQYKTDAERCRENGWKVGTRLVGDEGYGPTVIEITAVGEQDILAKVISHNGVPEHDEEASWTLAYRDRQEVPNNQAQVRAEGSEAACSESPGAPC